MGDILEACNARRREAAARTTAKLAAQVLESGSYVPTRYRRALEVRIDAPHASLAELAAGLGWSKDTYAAVLRRALSGVRNA